MSRTAAAAAIFISTLTMAGAALAGDPVTAPAAAAAVAPAERQPATAAERAAYDRSDALARSVFWARENEISPADPVAGVKLAQALRELGQYAQAAATAQQGSVPPFPALSQGRR